MTARRPRLVTVRECSVRISVTHWVWPHSALRQIQQINCDLMITVRLPNLTASSHIVSHVWPHVAQFAGCWAVFPEWIVVTVDRNAGCCVRGRHWPPLLGCLTLAETCGPGVSHQRYQRI